MKSARLSVHRAAYKTAKMPFTLALGLMMGTLVASMVMNGFSPMREIGPHFLVFAALMLSSTVVCAAFLGYIDAIFEAAEQRSSTGALLRSLAFDADRDVYVPAEWAP